MKDWNEISGLPDPRGPTALAGMSVGRTACPVGVQTPLLRWAGSPKNPVRCHVLVGPPPSLSAAELNALLDRRSVALVRWSVGFAQYEAEVDATSRGFSLTASSVDLYFTNNAPIATAVQASIVPHIADGPRPTRTVVGSIPGIGGTLAVPRFAERAMLIANPAGAVVASWEDAQGNSLGSYFFDPSLSIVPAWSVPTGAALLRLTNGGAAFDAALVCDLSI